MGNLSSFFKVCLKKKTLLIKKALHCEVIVFSKKSQLTQGYKLYILK